MLIRQLLACTLTAGLIISSTSIAARPARAPAARAAVRTPAARTVVRTPATVTPRVVHPVAPAVIYKNNHDQDSSSSSSSSSQSSN
ncbi:MAG: hypothetical protein P1U34_12230 [Coxiellaceae bacterium]|nr:hypothetical protein [Coxiellaceae bacterium]